MLMIDAKILATKEPFSELPPHLLEELTDAVSIAKYQQGEVLFSLEDHDEYDAYLIWGEITLLAADGKSMSLQHRHPQARFALAKLKPRRFTATVTRKDTCILWVESDVLEQSVSGFRDSQLPDEDTILIVSNR